MSPSNVAASTLKCTPTTRPLSPCNGFSNLPTVIIHLNFSPHEYPALCQVMPTSNQLTQRQFGPGLQLWVKMCCQTAQLRGKTSLSVQTHCRPLNFVRKSGFGEPFAKTHISPFRSLWALPVIFHSYTHRGPQGASTHSH